MILNFKTGKLPPNFIYLGILFLGVGVWRIILLDWIGIIFLVVSFCFLFIKSGILIDASRKKLKIYIGFLGIKKGNWEDISSVKYLQIIKITESQSMNVVSIARNNSQIVYKLILIMPNKKIEILKGDKDFINKVAEKIEAELQTTVLNNTT